MLHHTKSVVLRTVKYGETSVIVTMYTEIFGLQSYLVHSVRTNSKKSGGKVSFFQPAALLDVVAYHHEFKNLQRLKEYKWEYLYQHIFSDVKKNAVALFMIELFTRSVKQPEANADLFSFLSDALLHLDDATDIVTANYPLYFGLHLAHFFGFAPQPPASNDDVYFDLREGSFTKLQPSHPHFLEADDAAATAEVLRVMQPHELEQISLNQTRRRKILHALEDYYRLHVQDFGQLKSLPVLKEIMS